MESMHEALMEMTKKPPFLRKYWELRPTIRACAGWRMGREGRELRELYRPK